MQIIATYCRSLKKLSRNDKIWLISKLIFPIPVLSFIDINLNDINCLEIMFGYTIGMKILKLRIVYTKPNFFLATFILGIKNTAQINC